MYRLVRVLRILSTVWVWAVVLLNVAVVSMIVKNAPTWWAAISAVQETFSPWHPGTFFFILLLLLPAIGLRLLSDMVAAKHWRAQYPDAPLP